MNGPLAMSISLDSKITFKKRALVAGYEVFADGESIGAVGKVEFRWMGTVGDVVEWGATRGEVAAALLAKAVESASQPEPTITVYTTFYAKMVEGDDEPQKTGERTDEYVISVYSDVHGDWSDDETKWIPAGIVETAVHILTDGQSGMLYASEASATPASGNNIWYSEETYKHPYTGERTERTAHLSGFSEDEQRAVYAGLVKAGALRDYRPVTAPAPVAPVPELLTIDAISAALTANEVEHQTYRSYNNGGWIRIGPILINGSYGWSRVDSVDSGALFRIMSASGFEQSCLRVPTLSELMGRVAANMPKPKMVIGERVTIEDTAAWTAWRPQTTIVERTINGTVYRFERFRYYSEPDNTWNSRIDVLVNGKCVRTWTIALMGRHVRCVSVTR